MEAQLARLGIVAERVEAVPVANVPQHLIEAQQRPGRPWRITPGDLACGLSHQLVWQEIVQRNLDCALILEDDALLAPTLADFVRPGILERTGADIIRLETWASRARLGTREHRVGNTALRELASAQLGSAAYLISRDAAALSLAHPDRDDMAVDRFLFRRGGVHLLHSRVLQAIPAAAVQLHRSGAGISAALSDIAIGRPLSRAPADPTLKQSLRLELEHARRVVHLVMRDPAVIREPRAPIPFAGVPDQSRASSV